MSAPTMHSVHIYAESHDLVVHLSGIVASSLVLGRTVLIIATAAHQELLREELLGLGIDVQRYEAEGFYSAVDAEGTLKSFIVSNMPDRGRFRSLVIERLVKTRVCTPGQTFTVFGEMVALLWADGNQAAALSLEELWNEALEEMPFRLHCAYPQRVFRRESEITAVCQLHSSVLRSVTAKPFAAD
jgi:MEDS: MEthanogen/methylotroph, DcmR Sensory domain